MGNFSKAILIASVALCLHISAFSQGISLKNKEISVKKNLVTRLCFHLRM